MAQLVLQLSTRDGSEASLKAGVGCIRYWTDGILGWLDISN